MADNSKEIHDLDAIIERIVRLQQTINHINNTKSVNRFGKDIRQALSTAGADISDVTAWTKALQSQRNELVKIMGQQPIDIQKQISALVKTLGGVPKQMEAIAKKSATPFSNSFRQVFGEMQYLFTQQLKWYATKAVSLTLLKMPSDAIDSIKEYNQGLIDIAAVSRASQTAIDSLGKTIIDVATATKYDVSDIAEAGKMLAQAGLSIQEIQNTLGPVAQIATATGARIQDSADLMITALRAFKFESKDATKVADVFINTTTNSKVTIDGLRTAFNYLASTSANLNISLEDTSALIGVLANSGQKLSTASTGLRTTLLALTAPTQKMTGIFAKYGITVDQVNPSLHSMTEILDTLSKLSKEDLIQAFSIRSANAILALQNAGAGAISTLREAIKQNGVASAIASEQLLGLSNSWENLQQTISSTAALIGNKFTASTVDMLRGIQNEFAAYNQNLKDTGVQAKISFGEITSSILNTIVAYQAVKNAASLFNNKFVKAAGASFSDLAPHTTKALASFNRLKDGITSSSTTIIAAITLFGTRIKAVFTGMLATLAKIAVNPVFLAITVSIGAITTAISQLINNYVRGKQQIGEFLNNIDRQSVALGKTATAVNKLSYEFEQYNNMIKEAYANNEALAQSLMKISKDDYTAAKIKVISENLKELGNVKIPENLKNDLSGVIDLKGIDTIDEAISKIFATTKSSTEAFKQLNLLRDSLSEYFSNPKFAVDLQRSITGDEPNMGEKGYWYVQRAVILRDMRKFQQEVQQIIKNTNDPDELTNKLTEALEHVSVKYRDFAKQYLETYLAISRTTSNLANETNMELSKISRSFTEVQGTLARVSKSLGSSFYVTPAQQLKWYDDLTAALQKVSDLNSEYNKAVAIGNKAGAEALKQQRDEILKTVKVLESRLDNTSTISSEVAEHFTTISKSKVDFNSKELGIFKKKLKELQPSTKVLREFGVSPKATEDTINKIDALIKKQEIEIKELEAYGNTKEDVTKKIEKHKNIISELSKSKMYLIGVQNKEKASTKTVDSAIQDLVKTYKQLFTVNSANLSQLVRLNKPLRDNALERFTKAWATFTNISRQSSNDFETFTNQLGLSKTTFNELTSQYKEAAPLVYTYSKVLESAKVASQSTSDAYKNQVDDIDEVINALKGYEGKVEDVNKLLSYLRNYKTSIQLDFELKNAEKFGELQSFLLQIGKLDIGGYSKSLKTIKDITNKELADTLKRTYNFSDEQAKSFIISKEQLDATRKSLDIQKQYAESIANVRKQIKESETASLLELDDWYVTQQKEILDATINNAKERDAALINLQKLREEKINQIYLNSTIKEIQFEKEAYEQRLTYLENFTNNQKEQAEVRAEILRLEKEEAIRNAIAQGKNIADILADYEEKYNQIFINARIKEVQLEKETLEERLSYLEAFNATQAEKSKVRVEILKREKEENVKTAMLQGKDTSNIIARYDEEIKQEQLNTINNFNSMVEGFKYGMRGVAAESVTTFQATQEVVKSLADSMTNSLTSFLDYTGDEFLKWGKLVQNILNDVYNALVRQMIISPIVSGIAGVLAPSSSSSASFKSGGMVSGGLMANQTIQTLHKGGIVGKEYTSKRKVPTSLFMNAPRLHSGGYIKSNEVPTILKKGETVLTPEQMKIVSANKPNVSVQVIDQRGNGSPVEAQTTTDAQGNVNVRLLVRDEVRKTLASGGADSVMNNSFALQRKPIRR